jgi:hypothetical protein
VCAELTILDVRWEKYRKGEIMLSNKVYKEYFSPTESSKPLY